jgi:hypothetical protein
MKTMHKILMFLLATTLAITACKKDDTNSSSSPKSATDFLTGGSSKSWEVESISFNGTPQTRDSCEVDDFTTFNKTGNTYTDNPGNITCGDSSTSGTWALSNSDKVLTMTAKGSSTALDINELTDNKLVLKQTFTDSSMGTPMVFNIIATLVPVK